jgi:prepilin-type N-terminal cleavage/methylation domain-containing protein
MMNKGYTLIEILIVIVIMGIVVTIGYSGLRDYQRRQILVSAARQLKADLKLAQEEALAGHKTTDCTGVLNGYEFLYVVGYQDRYRIRENCTNNDHILIKEVVLSQGIRMQDPPSVNPILFKPLGQGTNIVSGTTITIDLTQENTGDTQSVRISASGEIQ